MATYLFANNAQSTTTAILGSAVTSITVQSGAAFSAPGTGDQFVARIDDTGTPGSTKYEYILVTANSGNVLTAIRGVEGTSAQAFATAATITQVFTAAALTSTPRGTLGYVQVVAAQGTITAEVALTSLTIAAVVGAGRRIRVSAYTSVYSTVANDAILLNIREGGTYLKTAEIWAVVINQDVTLNTAVILTPTAGSHTYFLSMSRPAGTGSVTMNASTTNPAYLLVEDVGV